jgi:hypothetical protein
MARVRIFSRNAADQQERKKISVGHAVSGILTLCCALFDAQCELDSAYGRMLIDA